MAASIFSAVGAAIKKVPVAAACEVAGAVTFLAGVIQLFHHAAIAACVVGGSIVFLTGKKLRAKVS